MAFVDVPDTYYRVSVKALVFDDEQRLLVFKERSLAHSILLK